MAEETKLKANKKQAWEMPLFNFTKLLENYKIPGVDFAALMNREKKNIEA